MIAMTGDPELASPIACRYRVDPRFDGEGAEVASCGLAGEVTGVSDADILQVSRAVCELCVQRVPAPDAASPNPVAASLVVVAGERILERGGVPECDPGRARSLMGWAAQHLDLAGSKANMRASRHGRRDPCLFLGEQTGERPCINCQGSVRQKVFSCGHADHGDTTIADCGSCPDHEARLKEGRVTTWAVGVTTAPRAEATLEQSLRSLAAAGWDDAIVFAEPESAVPDWLDPHRLVQRPVTLGAWPNWMLSLQELTLRYPWADAYLICQDDVVYARDVRGYLEKTLWPVDKIGVVSLHTAMHQETGVEGYSELGEDQIMAWGAQAYVFPNAAARALLRSAISGNHRNRGPRAGLCNIDTIVGQWCEESGFPYLVHSPSPTQHIGYASAIWEPTGVDGRRSAATFPGESESLCKVMGKPEPEPEPVPPEASVHQPDSWDEMRLAICSPVFDSGENIRRWQRWLLEAELPPYTTLFLLDDSGDVAFSETLQSAAGELANSDRFEKVNLHIRRKPPKADRKKGFRLDWIIADAYNTALQKSARSEDYVLLLNQAMTPPRDCLRLLFEGMSERRAAGERPGAISACYPAEERPGYFAAARSMVNWTKLVRTGSLEPDEVVKIGAAGTACLLVDGPLFWSCAPLRGESINGLTGADSYLCSEIRRQGYSLWLHGGVLCEIRREKC